MWSINNVHKLQCIYLSIVILYMHSSSIYRPAQHTRSVGAWVGISTHIFVKNSKFLYDWAFLISIGLSKWAKRMQIYKTALVLSKKAHYSFYAFYIVNRYERLFSVEIRILSKYA